MTNETDDAGTPHPSSPGKLLVFSSTYLLRWVLYALIIGAAVGTASFAFEWTLYHLRVLISHTWLWGLPVAGGLLVASFPFGARWFILNTLRILENVSEHPAADRLLLNLVRMR